MDKILHDPKDPKLWELWYIPYYGSCRILSISRIAITVFGPQDLGAVLFRSRRPGPSPPLGAHPEDSRGRLRLLGFRIHLVGYDTYIHIYMYICVYVYVYVYVYIYIYIL